MNNQPRLGLRGWEKWLVMSLLILALASIIIWFNLDVFGTSGAGLAYTAVVAFVVLISFIVTRHIKYNPVTTNFLRAAFFFEILLAIALAVNVTFSLSVWREMSVAGQGQRDRTAAIDAAGKLRGSRNQRQALEYVRGNESNTAVRSREQIFGDNERVLFWIMIGELSIAILATFVLLGLSVFDRNLDGVPDILQNPRIGNLPEDRARYERDKKVLPQLEDRWASKSPAMSPAPQTAQDKLPKT